MNRILKKIILLLLMLTLTITAIACVGNTPETPPVDDKKPPVVVIDKTAVFNQIKEGLTNAADKVHNQKVRYVNSEYTVIVNQINVSIFYEANYNIERKQDSEIKLKIYENQTNSNTLFLYYYKGTLYYEMGSEKMKIEGFGGTSTFEMFYQFVTAFDMETFFFTADFAEMFNSMSLFAEASNITVTGKGTKRENITIVDVNLDKIKNRVNNFIKRLFGKDAIGTKLDALTSALLGIKFSQIGEIEIGLFNASNTQVMLEDKAVTDFNMTFSGTQSDNVNTYYFDIKYLTRPTPQKIKLDKFDDIETNIYKGEQQGKKHYTGSLYIPQLKETFSADIQADLNTTDNAANKFKIKIGEIIDVYYAGGTMYTNIEGLIKHHIGNGIDLGALNFPKVKVENLNLAEQINNIATAIMRYASENLSFEGIFGDINWGDIGDNITGGEGSLIAPDSALGVLLKHVESNGTIFKITIDEELIGAMLSENSTTIVDFITSLLGISEETLTTIVGAGVFNNVTAEITYNTANGEIGISMFSSGQLMFKLSLKEAESDVELDIQPPQGFVASEYKDLIIPESIALHLEGELRMQGENSVDFGPLMGAFIGDVTGVNTPFSFAIKDRLYLSADFWLKDKKTYSMVSLWFNPTYNNAIKTAENISSEPLLTIATDPDNSDVFLINNAMFGIKYVITRAGLSQAFVDLLGKDNIFNTQNIIDILKILTQDTTVRLNENDITFTLSPYTENGVEHDPIFKILGIKSLIAELSAKVGFAAPQIDINSNEYETPKMQTLKDLHFQSIYQAKWHNTVDVTFGNKVINFKLSFIGKSAQIVSGTYYYKPEAKLFGEDVDYVMVLTDTQNGTKLIRQLGIESLRIDPTVKNAIPSHIPVVYEDGTMGEQPFSIINFPYTNENINLALLGKKIANYQIVIGAGSISEQQYNLPIEVLNRTVVTVKESNGVTDAYYGEIPVVSIVYIDPYQYAINKKLDADYSPFAKDLVINFQSTQGADIIDRVVVSNYIWDFNYNHIQYSGGIYFVVGYYNTLKIAMRVEVTAKIVDNIMVTGENYGEYTVDALIASSYNIPVASDSAREVRIYFKTGRYRVIGEQPEGWVNEDTECDGYYPMSFAWQYAKADNVSLDKSINPLNGGRTNINYTSFGDDIAGKQQVKLTVNSPSRRLTSMIDNIHGITELVVDPLTGEINEDLTVRESIKLSAVGLGAVNGALDSNGIAFPLDPYSKAEAKVLPGTITMDIEHAGKIIRRAYVINWEESSIIDREGNIKIPVAAENYFMATGWIGETEKNRQLVTVVIHNLSGAFDSLEMTNPNDNKPIELIDGKYSITIDPYSQYILPERFTLIFSSGKSISHDTAWKIMQDGEEILIDANFKFSARGGEYVVNTYVVADSANGILAQKVTLNITVQEKVVKQGVVYGLSSAMRPNEPAPQFLSVAPYTKESRSLLKNLLDMTKFGILFADDSYISDELPISWDNLQEVIDALENEGGTSQLPGNVIVLKGKVHRGSAALEQEVSVAFRVEAKRIISIGFPYLDDITLANKIVSVISDIDLKTINIRLLKPFILTTNVKEQASPSEYLKYLFSNIRLSFDDDSFADFAIEGGIPDDLDEKAFQFGSGQTESRVKFILERFSGGSRAEKYEINLYTTKDALLQTELDEKVETFFADGGTPKYPEGFKLPSKLEVTYEFSGKVTYDNLIWISKGNYKANDNDNDTILTIDTVVPNQTIPSSLFKTMIGSRIYLYTILPNGEMITKAFAFYGKDIGQYLYNADGAIDNYNVFAGRIIVNNIYEIYPFDAAKLPKMIIPLSGTANPLYQISEIIKFGVVWVPSKQFASASDPAEFDQDLINKYFNSKGYTSDYESTMSEPFATATIRMYNGESQTIKLFVDVAPLDEGIVTHPDVNIVKNTFAIDPYYNNFGGEYTLPKDVTITFDGGSAYTFNPDKDSFKLQYAIQKLNGEFINANSIKYTHLGHSLGAEYGSSTSDLRLRITLPDGKTVYLTLNFLSRELTAVSMQNMANKPNPTNGLLNGVYYIDPYDASTFTVPTTAVFSFKVGEDIELNISEWRIAENAEDFTSDYRYKVNFASYLGAEYEFNSRLSGYGVEAQEFSIKVIVLQRELKSTYRAEHTFEDPIMGLVSDIAHTLTADKFKPLSDEKYALYNSIATPVVPDIKWDLTNDDIVYSGITNRQVNGYLSYSNVYGESAQVNINAPAFIFSKVDSVDDVTMRDNIIDFNPFTKESLGETFRLKFQVGSEAKVFAFTSKEHAGDLKDVNNYKARAIIDWGRHTTTDEQKLETFTIGNAFKTIKIEVKQKYRYRYNQIGIDAINFGFASDGSDGYQESSDAELVIDPLNPVVPNTVLARGKDPDTQEPIIHGNVKIVWDSEIYNMPINATEAYKEVGALVTAYADDGITQLSQSVPFVVKVYYLNRTPVKVYTRDRGFSDTIVNQEGLYTLQSTNTSTGKTTSNFRINPIELITYDPDTNTYFLPTNLIFTFKDVYNNRTLNNAVERLGKRLEMTELKWNLSDAITLNGTETYDEDGTVIASNPITAIFTKCRISYDYHINDTTTETVTSELYDFGDSGKDKAYELKLQVTNRTVEYTSISEKVNVAGGTSYQKALPQYFIDPYEENYASSFPTTITIKYSGDSIVKKITNIEWTYDEAYLQRPDVISGSILNGGNPNAMTTMANITVFGTKLSIQFPIKARNIDTTEHGDGGDTTKPISGGTIYLLKGIPALDQLPKFMYYKFDSNGSLDVAPVPLEFSTGVNGLYGFSTDKAGITQKVLATLGSINKDNIEFTLEVIDPTVTNIKESGSTENRGYKQGSSTYDRITVARNGNNYYVIGKEATILPKTVVINSSGNILTVTSIDYHIQFENGIETSYAVFNCKYTFRGVTDSQFVSGNASGIDEDSDKLTISFKVPVGSYDYTKIDTGLIFNKTNKPYTVALGTQIMVSALPTATDDKGKEYQLFWDLSGVDTNRAGTYTAYGYYMTTSGKNLAVSLAIVVEKQTIDSSDASSDIKVDPIWLNRVYTGKLIDIADYLTIRAFLRDNGEYAQVEKYDVEYSLDLGISWQKEQPVNVKANDGDYWVRITIVDYNIEGSKIFKLNIKKSLISDSSISFHQKEESEKVDSVAYEYDGSEKAPFIKGIPDNATLLYDLKYEIRNADGTYSTALPINAGIYRVTLSFPEQKNYRSESEFYQIFMTIMPKDVRYSIESNLVYNGLERDVIVAGLPTNLAAAGVKVRYQYYNEDGTYTYPEGTKLKNVGTYRVTVFIDGGVNFPSANVNGNVNSELRDYTFNISRKKIIIKVNTLTSEYLDPIKALNSAISIVDASNTSENGLQGSDSIALFRHLIVTCTDTPDGMLTYRHMVGTYTLRATPFKNSEVPSNYEIIANNGYIDGQYIIAKGKDAVVIENKAQLDGAISHLRDAQEVKWYLKGDNYGSIVIDKNATVSIVGSYDLRTGELVAKFDNITISNGGVTLDILSFKAVSNKSSVNIGNKAQAVTVSRSEFIRGGTSYLISAVAISSDSGYKNTLTIKDTLIYGYSAAIYMRNGSLSISNTTFDSNVQGVQIQNGNIFLLNVSFNYTKGTAVYILAKDKEVSINDCTFNANVVGVKSYITLNNDIDVQNTFINNAINIQQIY